MVEKDRTTAIVLAVFLSFWTWLYTYKKDSTKFWIGLVSSLAGIFLLFIPSIGIWIWSIVDTVKKDDKWYKNY